MLEDAGFSKVRLLQEGRDFGPVLDGRSDDCGKRHLAREDVQVRHIEACLNGVLEWRR